MPASRASSCQIPLSFPVQYALSALEMGFALLAWAGGRNSYSTRGRAGRVVRVVQNFTFEIGILREDRLTRIVGYFSCGSALEER